MVEGRSRVQIGHGTCGAGEAHRCASLPSTGAPEPAAPPDAPAAPPAQPAANPNDGPAIAIEPAALETETPEIQPTEFQSKVDPAGRDAVLAAFSRTPPQPASPQPRPAVRQVERTP